MDHVTEPVLKFGDSHEGFQRKIIRKRTKTGCITCRRRRIKCDEGRPVCRNCDKAKRDCAGYIPRVIFKSSVGAFQNNNYGPVLIPRNDDLSTGAPACHAYPSTTGPFASGNAGSRAWLALSSSMSSLQPIAPRPQPTVLPEPPTLPPQFPFSDQDQHLRSHQHVTPHHRHHSQPHPQLRPQTQHLHQNPHLPSDPLPSPLPQSLPTQLPLRLIPPELEPSLGYFSNQYSIPCNLDFVTEIETGLGPCSSPPLSGVATAQTFSPLSPVHSNLPISIHPRSSLQNYPRGVTEQEFPPLQVPSAGISVISPQQLDKCLDRDAYQFVFDSAVTTPVVPRQLQLDLIPRGPGSRDLKADEPDTAVRTVPDSGTEFAEDDDEDEDDEMDEEDACGLASRTTLSALIIGQADMPSFSTDPTRMRPFPTRANDRALATYAPVSTHSPLNNAMTAAVFAHFVGVIGPSMSLYERHPFEDARMLDDSRDPQTTRHNIWTYTFPILSFSHPALMQAMLALGSLQMETLQQVPPTAAMKHYHLAIRRLGRCVGSPARRTNPETIAATMLLAYFEVWHSDHSKWCNHLYGARILLGEIPFLAMTRSILPIQRASQHSRDRSPLLLDVPLLNSISGCYLSPTDYGQVDDSSDSATTQPVPESRNFDREIEHYEHLRDLFWWYCKMDMYQSILSGTKLFMQYKNFVQCPPRAPIGIIDAIYGTYDHVMLLLVRLADFAARDVERKLRLFRPQGLPGMSPPMFFGMMPSAGTVSAPSAFLAAQAAGGFPSWQEDNKSTYSDLADLEACTAAALAEWERIREAFDTIRARFGPHFEAVRNHYTERRESPFGPALRYRTFSMAGIWMNFYMGLIRLHRVHPSMPPFSLIAAGRASQRTAALAETIGCIAAGLADDSDLARDSEVSTLVGAALIESCFCLFVAGVQFQHLSHRRWLIRRLHTTARLTGWQSARQIANGCESAWIKAAQLEGAPPYVADDPDSLHSPPMPANASMTTGAFNNIDYFPGGLPSPSPGVAPRDIDHVIRQSEFKPLLVRSEQARYALGLLGVERDLEQLDLKEEAL